MVIAAIRVLQDRRARHRARVSEAERNMTEFQANIDDLDRLYNEMREMKDQYQDQRRFYLDILNTYYPEWAGEVHTNRYSIKLSSNIINDSLSPTIQKIDQNLDELNRKKTYYQNRISETRGLIGQLESVINSIGTEIENFFN